MLTTGFVKRKRRKRGPLPRAPRSELSVVCSQPKPVDVKGRDVYRRCPHHKAGAETSPAGSSPPAGDGK